MFETIANYIGEMRNRTDSYHCINLLTGYSCILTSWVKCESNKFIGKVLKSQYSILQYLGINSLDRSHF